MVSKVVNRRVDTSTRVGETDAVVDDQGDQVSDPVLAQLRALQAVSGGEGYAVARGRGLSRTQLWQQIYRLERYVNGTDDEPASRRVRLVRPGGRELTQTGRDLLLTANPLLEAVDQIKGFVADLRRTTSEVRVACFPALAHIVASAANSDKSRGSRLLGLAAVTDDLRRDLGGDLLRGLHGGEYDMVIAPAVDILDASVRQFPLYRWDLVAVCSETSTLYGREKVSIAELEAVTVLASPVGHQTRALCSELSVSFESSSVDALFELADIGYGVAIVAGDSVPIRQREHQNLSTRAWPVVTREGKALGGTYATIIRSSSGPETQAAVREVAKAAAERLGRSLYVQLEPMPRSFDTPNE
jgi:DNA-binding transcriptional LysR family regulator